MRDELRRFGIFGSGVAELTRNRAEKIVKDLVKAGEVRRKESSGLVRELLERSKENRKELARFVRSEIQNQLAALGVASKRDLERLERRIARLEDRAKTGGAKSTTRKKSTAKKTTRSAPGPGSTG